MKGCCLKVMPKDDLMENSENGIFITKDGILKLLCYLALLTIFAIIKIHFILWFFRKNSL